MKLVVPQVDRNLLTDGSQTTLHTHFDNLIQTISGVNDFFRFPIVLSCFSQLMADESIAVTEKNIEIS